MADNTLEQIDLKWPSEPAVVFGPSLAMVIAGHRALLLFIKKEGNRSFKSKRVVANPRAKFCWPDTCVITFMKNGIPVICAWCHPNYKVPGVTHGICPFHEWLMYFQMELEDAFSSAPA